MRKILALLGAGAMLSIVPATPALSQVIDTHDGICNMIVPSADGTLGGAHVEGNLFVRTNNSWTTMTCHFNLSAAEAPKKTTHASGFACYIPPLPNPTYDTRASASPGGRMVLTCRYKN